MYVNVMDVVNKTSALKSPRDNGAWVLTLHCLRKEAFTVKWKKGGGIWRSECVAHHILPGVLPRRDEDVVPGQRQHQRQWDHVELEVPNQDDKKLTREKEKTKTLRKREARQKRESAMGRAFTTPSWTCMEGKSSERTPTICATGSNAQTHSYAES